MHWSFDNFRPIGSSPCKWCRSFRSWILLSKPSPDIALATQSRGVVTLKEYLDAAEKGIIKSASVPVGVVTLCIIP